MLFVYVPRSEVRAQLQLLGLRVPGLQEVLPASIHKVVELKKGATLCTMILLLLVKY